MPSQGAKIVPYRMAAGMTETRRSGAIVDQLPATGDLLFRWRSYMPLLLIPLFALSVADDRPPTSFAWEAVCFGVASTGLLIRAFVIGTAPEGTSARGTRRPTADTLMTSGAYSVVRHPLYVANTLMWLGCGMISGTWFLPVILVLLSFIYHERIAAREEAFLHSTFGERFEEWTRTVPAMIPDVDGYRPSGVPFQSRKVLMQESHGLFALGSAFLVLDTLEGLHAAAHVSRRSRAGWRSSSPPRCRFSWSSSSRTPRAAHENIMSGMRVDLGSERLLASGQLKGRRVGIVSNPASSDVGLRHIVDTARRAQRHSPRGYFRPAARLSRRRPGQYG